MAEFDSFYTSVTRQFASVGDYSFYIAETPVIQGRVHRRIIGLQPGVESTLHGKPICYADAYVSAVSGDESVYVYLRHRLDKQGFFNELDYFLEDRLSDFPELVGAEFETLCNIGSKPLVSSVVPPFGPSLASEEDLRFWRVALPFGDLAVEFGKTHPATGNQLSQLEQRVLTKSLEVPLLGCDVSRTGFFVPLMAKAHWAAETIPVQILEQIIGQVTFNPVAV